MKKFVIMSAIIISFCGRGFAQVGSPESSITTSESFPRMTTATTAEVIQPATVESIPRPSQVPVTEEQKPKPKAPSVKYRDVPDDHWAASSVYDLVNMGVTQGYPDGTFRGNNNITRYETAMFLSKLANSIGSSSDKVDIEVEKIKDDLRAEIRSLRADLAELKQTPVEGEEKPITGSFMSRIVFGNLIATNSSVEGQPDPIGPLMRYRLKLSFAKNLGETSKVKVNLDTMDSGFGGGSGDLSTRILDVDGTTDFYFGLENPMEIKATAGPGPVVHTEEADSNGNYIDRTENGTVYVRPWNSISASTRIGGIDMGLGYIARVVDPFGKVDVNQIDAFTGFDFPGIFFIAPFRMVTTIDYLSNAPQASPAGPNDTKVTFDITTMMSQKLKTGIIYSFGNGESPHNSMAGVNFDLLDVWDTGTMINFKYRKVGSEYLRDNAVLGEDLFAGLDVFDRYIGDGGGLGVVDVGYNIVQTLTESVRLFNRVDWRLAGDNSYGKDFPQSGLTIDGGVDWDIATDTLLEALYRVDSIPSLPDISNDMTQISLTFKY